MDKKTPKKDWSVIPEDDTKKIFTHFYGCMGGILLFAILLYWLIQVLKGII